MAETQNRALYFISISVCLFLALPIKSNRCEHINEILVILIMLDIWGLPHLVKLACYIYSSGSQSEGFKKKKPSKTTSNNNIWRADHIY